MQTKLTSQDQVVYLHHEELKNAEGLKIDDGLTIIERPDRTGVKDEYANYGQIDKLKPEERDALRLKSLQAGKISTRRAFFGVRRGTKDAAPHDDAGVFIKNKWGRDAIKLYVDNDNKPHFKVYDSPGESRVYELKIPER